MSCRHEQFQVAADTNAVLPHVGAEPTRWTLALRLRCRDCGLDFEFDPAQGAELSVNGRVFRVVVKPAQRGRVWTPGMDGGTTRR